MTSMAERVDLLRSVDLFHALNGAQLQKIARVVDDVTVHAGRPIVREKHYRDAGGASFFLIVEGSADVTVGGKRVARLEPGDSFGEMSLLDGKPRSATVTARNDMHLYRIRSWDFQRLVKTESAIALALLRTLAGRLRAAEEPKRRR